MLVDANILLYAEDFLSAENGCVLASTDGDFARFPRLKWINPLAP